MWNPLELSQAREIVADIDNSIADASTSRFPGASSSIVVRTSEAARFKPDLRCFDSGLIIRHLSNSLGLDEHWPFRWRLEHKLIQALVIQHYCPGVFPITRGLASHTSRAGLDPRKELLDLFPSGYYIKTSLGFASRDRGQTDTTDDILSTAAGGDASFTTRNDVAGLASESFVVQERLDIETEYRIHSVYSRVIEDLTFLRYQRGHLPAAERAQPNLYMQSVLNRLPAGLLRHSIVGWDVARLRNGSFVIVEANLSGFHPVFDRGFQCSGYFLHPVWGPVLTARLIRHLERHENLRIHIELDLQDLSTEADTYMWVRRWKDLLAITGAIAVLRDDVHIADQIANISARKRPGWHRRFYNPLQSMLEVVSVFEGSIPPPPVTKP